MSSYSTRMAYLDSQRAETKVRTSVWAGMRAMMLTWRTRRLLATMDDRMLADIGIGRGEVTMELSRPIWNSETLR